MQWRSVCWETLEITVGGGRARIEADRERLVPILARVCARRCTRPLPRPLVGMMHVPKYLRG